MRSSIILSITICNTFPKKMYTYWDLGSDVPSTYDALRVRPYTPRTYGTAAASPRTRGARTRAVQRPGGVHTLCVCVQPPASPDPTTHEARPLDPRQRQRAPSATARPAVRARPCGPRCARKRHTRDTRDESRDPRDRARPCAPGSADRDERESRETCHVRDGERRTH